MGKIAIVTGGSSGIGRAAADALFRQGCTVYEFSRRGEDRSGVRHITADVTDENSVASAVAAVTAGFGISGAVEFTEPAEARRQVDVNFWGMVNVTKAVLPVMRRQGAGRIVNTSSVAAVTPIPFQTYYSVSKAAINSFTMSLANEVRPYGITVCAVMPGDTRTGFTDARSRSFAGDEEYGGRIRRSVARMEKDERGGASPEGVGALIARAALRSDHKVLYTAGFTYKLVILLMRLLPSTTANWILGLLYAK